MLEEKFGNPELFFNIPTIDLGTQFVLRGIDVNYYKIEIDEYFKNCNDLSIKRFLPKHYVETESQAKKIMDDFLNRFLYQAGILFCIALKHKKNPYGYIYFNSPKTALPDGSQSNFWTVDFWLYHELRSKGLMTFALNKALGYMQKMNVPSMHAFVDTENIPSIRVLEKNNFHLADKSKDNSTLKYSLILN